MTKLAGAHVVITGGASGLGRSMARAIARRGGALCLWDRDRAGVDAVVAELKATGAEATSVVCDITDREAVYASAAEIVRPVDILMNNAGVVSGKALLDTPDAQIEKTFEVNALAPFWMLKAFLPGMLERDRGHVVTMASAAGLIGVPRLADYCSSKFAAVGLDESLRVELKKMGSKVRTTVVCPYYIDTGMFAGVKTRFSLLLPIQKEDQAVEKILRAVERDRARLLTPPIVHTISLLRMLPVSWFDTIARIMGISASMDEFIGRRKKSGDTIPISDDQHAK